MKRWEYAVFAQDTSGFFSQGNVNVEKAVDELDEYGDEGWELVSAIGTNDRGGGTTTVLYVFKRLLA